MIGDLPENNKASACHKVLFYVDVSQPLIVPGNSCKLSINHPLRESMMYCSHVAIQAHSTAKVTFKVIIAKPSCEETTNLHACAFWMHAKWTCECGRACIWVIVFVVVAVPHTAAGVYEEEVRFKQKGDVIALAVLSRGAEVRRWQHACNMWRAGGGVRCTCWCQKYMPGPGPQAMPPMPTCLSMSSVQVWRTKEKTWDRFSWKFKRNFVCSPVCVSNKRRSRTNDVCFCFHLTYKHQHFFQRTSGVDVIYVMF